MADYEEYKSIHSGQAIDDAVTKVQNINVFAGTNQGLVPRPQDSYGITYLRDDATWQPIDIDSKISKIPVSVDTNNTLPKINNQGELISTGVRVEDLLKSDLLRARNGIATLDAYGEVEQLPANKWVENTSKGVAGGVATLDSDGHLIQDANTVNGFTLGESVAAGLADSVSENTAGVEALMQSSLLQSEAIARNSSNIADIQTEIGSLKYQNIWIGSTICTPGDEQTTLSDFVRATIKRNPLQNDQVTVSNYGLDGQVWAYTNEQWKFFTDLQPASNATKNNKGLVQVGDGLDVDTGIISARLSNGGISSADTAASTVWASNLDTEIANLKTNKVSDVKIADGASLVDASTKIATIPKAAIGTYGAVRFNNSVINDSSYAATLAQVYSLNTSVQQVTTALNTKQDKLVQTGTSTKPVYIDNTGTPIAINYTIQKSVPADAVFTDTNTTYTFEGGKNCFYVTPKGSNKQTVAISFDAPSVVEPKAQMNGVKFYPCGVTTPNGSLIYNSSVYITESNVLRGAAWNDFAEFRRCIEPAGTVVCEMGDGTLDISRERMQAGAAIISDTYGMVIGPDCEGFKPIAVAGRVLAFFEGDINKYKPGAAVCASAIGTISPMTREEIKEYPDRILGYVSEIPTYDEWNGVSTKNRIWVKIK